MKNHKIGDKFVIEIDKIFEQDGETLYRAKGMKSLVFDEYGLNILTPMSHMHYSASEDARTAGQEEAWELAQKICCTPIDGGFNPRELIEIFGTVPASGIFSLNTYTEAAAKVAEWEKAKEEICVGDVVEFEGSYGVVVGVEECYIKGFTSDWILFHCMKKYCTKTGRHIDVDAWLAQIGGGSDE